MAIPKQRKFDWLLVAAVLGPIIGALGGWSITGFIEDRHLADKPYVDERVIEGKRYTDDKAASVLKEAIEHSDTNRREMNLKMEQMSSEYRISNVALSSKLDSVIEAIKDLRTGWYSARRK